jgi:ribosomal protein L17
MRNQLSSLILFESVTTTVAKAKQLKTEAQAFISKLNTSENEVNIKRYINSLLYGGAQMKAYDIRKEVSCVKTYKLDERFGDGAQRMIVKLVVNESKKMPEKKENKPVKSKK